jgi:hypothetical protein
MYHKSSTFWDHLRLQQLPCTDLCILAGDIGYPLLKRSGTKRGFSACPKWTNLLEKIKSKYKYVLYVPGNHEYYQAVEYKTDSKQIDELMREACDKIGVTFLNCNSWQHPEYSDMEFFGCTLWSDMKASSWEQMNDNKAFVRHQDFVDAHHHHFQWLKESLEGSSRRYKCVITHYLPSFELIHPRFATSSINDAFVVNCELLMKEARVHAWFFGHSHESCGKVCEGVRCFANPLGYPLENKWTTFSYDPISLFADSTLHWQKEIGSTPIGVDLVPEKPFYLQTASELEKARLHRSYQAFNLKRQQRMQQRTQQSMQQKSEK